MFIFPFYLCFPLSIAELKMEILRERELRESIEKQLMEDQRNRGKSILCTVVQSAWSARAGARAYKNRFRQ